MPGGPKLVHLTFKMDEGPKVKIQQHRVRRQQGDQRRRAQQQMKENKAALAVLVVHHRPGTYQEDKFDEDAEQVTEYYRDHGYISAQVGEPELKVIEDSKTRRRAGSSCAFRSPKGKRYKVGDFDVRRQHGRQDRGAASRCSSSSRASSTTRSGSARASRRRRKSTAPAATSSSPAIPDYKFSDDPNPAEPQTPEALRAPTGRGQGRRRSSTSRCRCRKASSTSSTASPSPATPRRATTSSAARCGCYENGVVQHRGAEVQHQAAEPARLLQGARGHGKDVDVEKTAERRQQGRRQAEARRAEPQPADLRRRRVAVRGLLRSAVVPDLELPRPRRKPDAVAAGRLARAELHGRVHRAVPVRPQHHRRRQLFRQRRPLHRPVHAEVDRRRR